MSDKLLELRSWTEVLILMLEFITALLGNSIAGSQNRIAVEPLENSHAGKIYSMSKIIRYSGFLTNKNYSLVIICTRILHQGQKIIRKFLSVFNIKLRNPHISIFNSLNKKSKTSGLIQSIVKEVFFLLSLIQSYNISSLRTCISERYGICAGIQQSGLLHNLHADKSGTSIIVSKHIRSENIDPLHQHMSLLSRRTSFRPSFSQ